MRSILALRAAGPRCSWFLVLGVALGCGCWGADATGRPTEAYERYVSSVFASSALTGEGTGLDTACDAVLRMTQAVAAALLIGSLIMQLRRSDTQMESIAASLLKVAFIATVPFWRTWILETADAMAGAAGYRAITPEGEPSPFINGLWNLLAQWVPPGSPYLDVLDGSMERVPDSGQEANWALHAWNWARGFAAANASLGDSLWAVVTGGARGTLVFAVSAIATITLSLVIALTYLAETLRLMLFAIGCSLLPIFIAGVGTDLMKAQSTRFLLRLGVIACWPVGWALANRVSTTMLERVLEWMNAVAAQALEGTDAARSVSVAAPYLSWGNLLVLLGVSLAVCGWVVATVFGLPYLLGKAVAAGSHAIGHWVGGASLRASITTSTPAKATAIPSSLAAHPPGFVSAARAREMRGESTPEVPLARQRPPVGLRHAMGARVRPDSD